MRPQPWRCGTLERPLPFIQGGGLSLGKCISGSSKSPKDACDALERRFSAREEGIQSSLISKLQISKVWNRSGLILTHRNYMVDLRSQLRDAGFNLSDQTFYAYFTESLPALDLFITLYEDNTYDVNLLCDKFAKYERCQKLRAIKSGKGEVSIIEWQCCAVRPAVGPRRKKEKKKRDLTDVTRYGCGKQGHLQWY